MSDPTPDQMRCGNTLKDGNEDYIVIEGETLEEIAEKANTEVAKRGGLDPWSKEI